MNESTTGLRIEAAHKTISKVFSEDYSFSIPAYQRPYSWERQQVEELLSDISDAMGPHASSDGFYFLGSIVLVKQHGSADAKVVDGQQRLTTLTILFSVLRDLTTDPKKRILREKYVKQAADPDVGLKEKLRLQLRKQDQSFFEKHVQSDAATDNLPSVEGLTGSKARIVENATLMRKALLEMDEARRTELIGFLLQSCYLVVVEVPTDTAARRIFTVLNARGLDLTATDILKADLLERAGEDKENALSERWENIELALGVERFNELFVHIRMVFERDKPRSALEVGFPAVVTSFRAAPVSFLDDVLEPYADAFLLVADDKELRYQFGGKTADLVRSLNRLDNKDWLPPLLLALHQKAKGKSVDVPAFVAKLERLAYFLFLTRADVNARMTRYADVIQLLEPKDGAKAKTGGLDISETEAHALFDALNGPVYLASRVIKPLLLRLDQASTDASATYDHTTVTVEHVCPQTIAVASQWDTWFADRAHHAHWLHRLGNLVLLDRRKNPAASNWDLERKKSVYFVSGKSSPFAITQEARQAVTWTPDDIDARQDLLVGRFASAWELEPQHALWKAAQPI